MFALKGGGPWVIDCIELVISDYFVIVFGFGECGCFVFEAIGVEGRSFMVIIVNNFELWSELFSDFLVVLSPACF